MKRFDPKPQNKRLRIKETGEDITEAVFEGELILTGLDGSQQPPMVVVTQNGTRRTIPAHKIETVEEA